MKINSKIVIGKILKRYKRFLADIELDSKEVVVAHVANTGSMKTCWEPKWKVATVYDPKENKKLDYSLLMTHNGHSWIGINTSLTNKLVAEAFEKKVIKELTQYPNWKAEHKIGESRLDFYLTNDHQNCYVEVKNVTMIDEKSSYAIFPDAVSERGQKHLQELIKLKRAGSDCAMIYVIQRQDTTKFRCAWEIDPEYNRLLNEAQKAGVKILAYQCSMSPEEIKINQRVEVIFTPVDQ